jgi:cysteine desulfurase
VRVSGGWGTTEADWARFADAWVMAWDKHKARLQERAKEIA